MSFVSCIISQICMYKDIHTVLFVNFLFHVEKHFSCNRKMIQLKNEFYSVLVFFSRRIIFQFLSCDLFYLYLLFFLYV